MNIAQWLQEVHLAFSALHDAICEMNAIKQKLPTINSALTNARDLILGMENGIRNFIETLERNPDEHI